MREFETAAREKAPLIETPCWLSFKARKGMSAVWQVILPRVPRVDSWEEVTQEGKAFLLVDS